MSRPAPLEERLRLLAPFRSGNWDEVLARARRLERQRRRRLTLTVATAALALAAGTALAIGNRVFGWFEVSKSPQQVPSRAAEVPYVSGTVLHRPGRPPQQLSANLLAPLLGEDAALAILSPRGRYLAYHAWRWTGETHGIPLLYVHDLRSGRDRLLARGAQTVAWRRDGRIAYFQGSRAEYVRSPYLGNVMVGSLGRAAVAWTRRPGQYEVAAWAGDKLLVAVLPCYYPACAGSPAPGIYTLDDQGRMRPVGLAALTALSPDGRYAVGAYHPVPGQDSPSSLVRIVDLARRRVLQTFDLARAAGKAGLRPLDFRNGLGGVWRENEVVADSQGGSRSEVVFLRVANGHLLLDDVLRVPRSAIRGARLGFYFGNPALVGRGFRRVVVAARGSSRAGEIAAIFTCDRKTRRCVRGRVTSVRPRNWFAVVDNPSRPLK